METQVGMGNLGEAIIAAKLREQEKLLAQREREPSLPTMKGFSRRLLNLLVHTPDGLSSGAIISRLGGRTGATYEALHGLTKAAIISKRLKEDSYTVNSREKYVYYLDPSQRERVMDMLKNSGGITKHYGPSKEDKKPMDVTNLELAEAVGLVPAPNAPSTEQVASELLNKTAPATEQVAPPQDGTGLAASEKKRYKVRTVRNRGMSKQVLAYMQKQNGAMLAEQVATALNEDYALVRGALDYLSSPNRSDIIKKPLPGFTRRYTYEAAFKTPDAVHQPKIEPITPPEQVVQMTEALQLPVPHEAQPTLVAVVETPADLPKTHAIINSVEDIDFHINRSNELTLSLNGFRFKLDRSKANDLLTYLARFDDVLSA